MDKETGVNLAESLHSTAIDLNKAAGMIAALGDDDEETKLQAEILDRCAEDCVGGAQILRSALARQQLPALPPRRVPPDRPNTHRTPPDRGSAS